MYFVKRVLFCLFFFQGFESFYIEAQTKTIPYQELPTSGGSPSGSNMFFGANMSASTITLTFAGPSDRWICIGLGTTMPNTDALIFSVGQPVSPNALGWNDYYINSYSGSGVTNDAIQNWSILSNNVALGQRTVVATRTLNTGDPNDAVIQYTASALSLVWARGASANYTIAYHGSTNRANNINLLWLSNPTASFTTASATVCQGASITYSNLSTGGQTTYTWNFQGGSPATSSATNPVVSYSLPGNYSVSLTASNAIGSGTFAQINYISISPTVAPSVTIVQSAGQNPMCSGASISFSASGINGGSTPSYQWKVNGLNAGTNSATFTSNTLTNNSIVNCVMSSNANCASPLTATSSAISITVSSTSAASVAVIQIAGSNPMCIGAQTTFSASPFNGGNIPSYQWKVNNVNVGTNSATFVTSGLNNTDVVGCELSSSSSCAISTLAISSGIAMTVSAILVPTVSVTLNSGTNPTCAGALLSFSAIPLNGGTAPVYQWQVNGANVGNNSPTFTSSTLGSGNSVTCIMTSNSPCSSPNSAISAATTITVISIPPIPIITPSGTISFCTGNSLVLNSSAVSGNNWSNGATTQSIVITSSGNFSVTQSLNGCTSPPSLLVNVTVNPLPVVSIGAVGPICLNEAPAILLGNPAGGVYSGTGVLGNIFTPSMSTIGTISVLYIYTDTNTCSDSAEIVIMVSECLGVETIYPPSSEVLIYPNPAIDLLFVSSDIGEIRGIQVMNLNGQVLLSEKYDHRSTLGLNLKGMVSGIYILEIQLPFKNLYYKFCKAE